MKYIEKNFNSDLKEKIETYETKLNIVMEKIFTKYQPAFAKKRLIFNASFDKNGNDFFTPGYHSFISIDISDESSEYSVVYMITIWECDRYFLGFPVSKNLRGSKIKGMLINESLDDIEKNLYEYIKTEMENI